LIETEPKLVLFGKLLLTLDKESLLKGVVGFGCKVRSGLRMRVQRSCGEVRGGRQSLRGGEESRGKGGGAQ